MLTVLKVLLGLFGIMLLLLSMRWIFGTRKIAAEHDIQYSSATGANYLKGDIGGVLLFGAGMVPLYLFHSLSWAYPIIFLLSIVIAIRIISLIIDGKSSQGMIAIIVELLMMGVTYAIYAMSV